jgi:hypothetical protein
MAKEPFIDGRANQQLLLYLYFVCQMAMETSQKNHSAPNHLITSVSTTYHDPKYFLHEVQFSAAIEAAHFPAAGTAIDASAAAIFTRIT